MAVSLWENPNYEELNSDKEESKEIVNSDIQKFNNDPESAEKEAKRIVNGLPDTLDEFSPEQQQQFIDFIEQSMSWTNLNFAPKNVENVPDIIPPYWIQQVDNYKAIRKNISILPIDQQESLKKAEKEAILQITKESKDVIDMDK